MDTGQQPETTDFPARLRKLRKAKMLSQAGLARRLEISQSAIGDYETGKARPSTKTLGAMSAFFGVSQAWLMYGEGPEAQESEGRGPKPTRQPLRTPDEFEDWRSYRDEFVRLNLAAFTIYESALDVDKFTVAEIVHIARRIRMHWEIAIRMSAEADMTIAKAVDITIGIIDLTLDPDRFTDDLGGGKFNAKDDLQRGAERVNAMRREIVRLAPRPKDDRSTEENG